ncbi:calcium/sodium antiporter [Sedimentibacter sp. zth1]|uniref:calcium/sodium antiporter n=1 Tax=Sedimentibacter sp. zth1 TaxID=2816908 RepID=UPI001A91272A|nr:calcium/sodium antiporter [Sedimentibacter sp. zth1]QSX06620.1 calcium/sodium antiporter [Sedimentibacter sp. zth1]
MEIFIVILLFVLGIILILKGGDYFVDAATWIAEVSGIPKFIVGATVVSLATTLPELIVSAMAAVDGKVGMAIGNAIGSVTCNTGLVMGISIVCIPAVVKRKSFAFKGILMIVSCLSLLLLSLSGELKLGGSLVLLAMFFIFIIENVKSAKSEISNEKHMIYGKKDIVINALKFIGGAAGIVIGARLLVDNGSELARIIGISESVIGLTVIAIGTSLPELITTIISIVKKQGSLGLGNILGANIIDVTIILPVCALLSGGSLPIAKQTFMIDIPVCFAVMGIFVIPTLFKEKLHRVQGIIMIAVYIAYIIAISFII